MPLVTTQVETFPHRSIAGELIDVEGLPFEDEFFRGTVPVVTEHEAPAKNGVLRCVGLGHQRSYELTPAIEDDSGPQSYWHDRYGNVFTTLVTKGNNFSEAALIKPASTYNAYGLQEGYALLRAMRASKTMREAGVDTEWIVRIEEPTQLNFDGELIAPAEYRRRMVIKLVGSAALSLEGAQKFGLHLEEKPTEQEIGEIAETIDKMEFFVTLRAMATPYRVQDLMGASFLNYPALEEVFATYNSIAPLRRTDFELLDLPFNLNLPPLEEILNSKGDVGLYFTEILPKLIGLNLARMHGITNIDDPSPAALTHQFLTPGNVTALGGIVDLDSVKGKELGLEDEPSGYAAIARDFVFLLDNEKTINGFAESYGHVFASDPKQFKKKFADNFFGTYMRIRFGQAENATSSEVEFLAKFNEYANDDWLVNRLNELSGPYVGELIETETAKHIQEPLIIGPEFMASRVYRHYVHGNEQCLYEMGYLPPADNRRPTTEEISNAMRQSFAGELIIGEDIFQEILDDELYEERIDQVFDHRDELHAKIRTEIKGTPLEGISGDAISSLLVFHPLAAVEASTKNYILPDADKVWSILTKAFEDLYLDQKFNHEFPETYFALLQHGRESIAKQLAEMSLFYSSQGGGS
jgi:hypothetical protein